MQGGVEELPTGLCNNARQVDLGTGCMLGNYHQHSATILGTYFNGLWVVNVFTLEIGLCSVCCRLLTACSNMCVQPIHSAIELLRLRSLI